MTSRAAYRAPLRNMLASDVCLTSDAMFSTKAARKVIILDCLWGYTPDLSTWFTPKAFVKPMTDHKAVVLSQTIASGGSVKESIVRGIHVVTTLVDPTRGWAAFTTTILRYLDHVPCELRSWPSRQVTT